MKRRAEQEAQTRLRITESAMELHGTLGPARTSVKAVADHAGVPRSTVYRHFPDEEALFGACSQHWAEQNPAPDIERWGAIADPDERLATGLDELYAYYGRTHAMLDKLHRDEETVPVVGQFFQAFHGFLAAARDVLAGPRASRRRRAAIGHAVAYTTWRSLTQEQQLGDKQAAGLMLRLVAEA